MKKLIILLIAFALVCMVASCNNDNNKGVGNNTASNIENGAGNHTGNNSGTSNNNTNTDVSGGNTGTSDNDSNSSGSNNDQSNTDPSFGTCDHTYSDKWSSNSNEHWHKATCEHTSMKLDVAPHTDKDEDGFCDICNYEVGHTHTFTDVWSYDETHHWRLATCSHTAVKDSLGAHIDKNSDGACDFCAIHMHVVSAFGTCLVCGTKLFDTDISDIEDVIDMVLSTTARVTGGRVEYENICTELKRDTSTSDLLNIILVNSVQEREILYTLGVSDAYYKVVSKATNDKTIRNSVQESWYQGLSGNSVFSVYSVNSGPFMLDAATPANLVGYNYVVSSLANARGAENLLYTLYRLSQSASASDYLCDYNGGVYSFSFNYLQLNTDTGAETRADYYELEVSFSISATGVLVELDVRCDCYTNSLSYEDPVENDLNNDYTFDQATNKITLKETAIPDTYTYSIVQYEGTRTYVSEHPKSEFVPEDFEIYLDSNLREMVNDVVFAIVGKSTRVYLGSFTPVGTSVSYLNDGFSAVCDSANVFCSVNAISSSVLLFPKEVGTYIVRVIAGDVVKEITVEAIMPTSQEIEPPENSVVVHITDNNTWADLAVFTASVDGDYTFTIAAGVYLGAKTETGSPWADFNRVDDNGVPRGGTITVSLKAGETYEFYVMSPEKNINVYIPYTISDYTGS